MIPDGGTDSGSCHSDVCTELILGAEFTARASSTVSLLLVIASVWGAVSIPQSPREGKIIFEEML